jgi:large conductance mechanosensitive channel
VGDVIMPPIGIILGGVDFSNLSIVLKAAMDQAPSVTLNYGKFIQTVIDFIIIAFSIFLLVKGINMLKRKEEEKPAEIPKQEVLLGEIRDLLKTKK